MPPSANVTWHVSLPFPISLLLCWVCSERWLVSAGRLLGQRIHAEVQEYTAVLSKLVLAMQRASTGEVNDHTSARSVEGRHSSPEGAC